MRTVSTSLILLLLAAALAACGRTPAPQAVIQTAAVEKTVVETVEVTGTAGETIEAKR